MTRVIEVNSVCKRYPIGRIKKQRKSGLRTLFEGISEVKYVQALERVTFDVHSGECVAIIGANGSGKSTLLSVIAGILRVDEGSARLSGKVISLLEKRSVLNGELTGDENRCFLSTLFGMTGKEIGTVRDEIFRFAGLTEFADTQVMKYSRGMKERLLLSIALHARPDILLLDEVLSEVDEVFRTQCLSMMRDLVGSGKTIVFVSHELGLLEQACGRALWLKDGRIAMDGDASMVLAKYRENAHHA